MRPTVSRTRRRSFAMKPPVASSDREAGCEPFNVPFPWSWQCLVEIVHVEDELALRRPEGTEVRQMGVPAALHSDPGALCARQVRCHYQGRPSVESKRGRRHTGHSAPARVPGTRLGLFLQEILPGGRPAHGSNREWPERGARALASRPNCCRSATVRCEPVLLVAVRASGVDRPRGAWRTSLIPQLPSAERADAPPNCRVLDPGLDLAGQAPCVSGQ